MSTKSSRETAALDAKAHAPLAKALNQSEQVKEKVEQCATELSSVNATLKQEIADSGPLPVVKHAIDKSEQVEIKVQECVDELASVNTALIGEIDERKDLEHKLSQSDAALSASKTKEKQSRHSALHDAVTGLPNLTLFNDRLNNALEQARRHHWGLAVMFIDLDKFKHINDTHGHDVGDCVLQMVAQRLLGLVRGGDTVSRRSGDEFLFLMLETGDAANVAKLATKIIANIAQECAIEDIVLTVRPSIGIALYPEDGTSAQDLLKNADTAMYAAKRNDLGFALYGQAIDSAVAPKV